MSASDPPPAAELHWDEAGQPISARYGDVYFSRDNGLAESRYVFLEQNDLPERWQAGFQQQTFYIGETGFGSGLNFLAAWQLWQEFGPADRELHFVSVEKAPLRKADMHRALALWPTLGQQADALLAHYPELPLAGFHPFHFPAARVRLTLIVAEAVDGLEQLFASDHPLFRRPFHRGMDAWFLDGFAPAKNPDMWQPPLFDAIAALSTADSTLATFTAAGAVRRELQRVGFAVDKRPGYGNKRHMIAARRTAGSAADSASSAPQPLDRNPSKHSAAWSAPWYVSPRPSQEEESREAIVIGAGLAGCHSANALARRGWKVLLLEQDSEIANGGSGNEQGIVYGKLSPDADGLAQFNLASLLFAQAYYKTLWERDAALGQQCGVLQLAVSEREARLQEAVARRYQDQGFVRLVSAGEASGIAGLPLQHGGLYFPQLGWISPRLLCRKLLDHPAITLRCNTGVAELRYASETNRWQLLDAQRQVIAASATVVIATAHGALDFPAAADLPLKAIRGQVSQFARAPLPLRTVLCGDGYLAPATADGRQSFGATFTLHNHEATVKLEDHRENLARLSASLPDLAADLAGVDPTQLEGRANFRCSTADYMPLVGPLADAEAMRRNFALLSVNARANIPRPGDYLPGLYLNLGHGSRGLAYTPLSAALLAAQMSGELLPLSRQLAMALNPARFMVRDLIRKRARP